MERAKRAVAALTAAVLLGALGGASPNVVPSLPATAASAPPGIAPAAEEALDTLVVRPERGSRAAAPAVTEPRAPGDAAIAPPPASFAGATPTSASPPAELTAAEVPEVLDDDGVWAVIIGVNDYPGRAADLRSAVNDADDMDEALARLGVPAERRLVLRDGEASAEVIATAADWLVSRAGPESTAVFFYAGHVRKDRAGEAIVAADGALVTDEELAARLAPLTGKAWIVMASCFGGGFTEVLAPGRLLTAAADSNSLAYENSQFGRSYLVQYMVRRGLIDGHGGDTAQGAFSYADTTLRREYPNRLPFQIDHAGEPILLSMEVPAVDPAAPPPPPPTSAPPPEPPAPPPPRRDDQQARPGDNDDDDGKCAGLRLGVVTCGP